MFRGPRGRLAMPTELPSLNKEIIYILTYLLAYYLQKIDNETFREWTERLLKNNIMACSWRGVSVVSLTMFTGSTAPVDIPTML